MVEKVPLESRVERIFVISGRTHVKGFVNRTRARD